MSEEERRAELKGLSDKRLNETATSIGIDLESTKGGKAGLVEAVLAKESEPRRDRPFRPSSIRDRCRWTWLSH